MKVIGILLLICGLAFAENALQELQLGNLQFSASLYKHLSKSNPGNIILSPLSVQIVLALTQLGAKGDTALELVKGLSLPNSPEKIKEAFKELLPKLKGNDLYSLDSANKVYVKQGVPVKPDFSKLAQEIFGAGFENIDFVKNVEAAASINKWVEGQTNGKIQNLVPAEALDRFTRMVLVNAIYFQGNWSSTFDTYATHKRKFFTSEKDNLDTDFMHQTAHFNYLESAELDATILELPYLGNEIVFTIAMPNKKEGLGALETRLEEVLKPQKLSRQHISLFLPKFKIESSFDLIPTLKELGIRNAFDDEKADFSGLLDNPEPLVISKVLQKAFINVTESGTEAAAATAVIMEVALSAMEYYPPPKVVDVNRPFVFSLRHMQTGHTLFVGRISSL